VGTAEQVWTRQKSDSPTRRPERVGAINGRRATASGSEWPHSAAVNPYRVTDHGADPSGILDSTSAINTAAADAKLLRAVMGVMDMKTIGAI
jgi:hypothetical protein